jgi:hypothetical protein
MLGGKGKRKVGEKPGSAKRWSTNGELDRKYKKDNH